MEHDDARARELTNLKLALATFALQLDAFELRTKTTRHAAGKAKNPVPPPNECEEDAPRGRHPTE